MKIWFAVDPFATMELGDVKEPNVRTRDFESPEYITVLVFHTGHGRNAGAALSTFLETTECE